MQPDFTEPPKGSSADIKRESCAACVLRVEGNAAAGNCEHTRERSCADCRTYPPFPLEGGRSQNFRIVQFRDPGGMAAESSLCDHYVAVSYCWSSDMNNGEKTIFPYKGPYTVRALNGLMRPNRAPVEVID